MYPKQMRYTKEHEWVAATGDVGAIGITDFAQHELGDIVYVELPAVGRRVKTGETLGTIESVKAVSEVYAPVSGLVTEVNAALSDAPETLNKDPHGAGWICKLKLEDPKEPDRLMDADAYTAFVAK
ncbi:MAG: glycine cleavage system protein GcvH [Acidobacteriia bacterium]|nr:glycine cleavage system protein GcvH [Terriglobia bacterium]